MTDHELLARLRLEPLDRKKHDRAAFSCGEDRVDRFLKDLAGRQQDEDFTRVKVCCLDNETAVVGYYAMNAHGIDVSSLPEEIRKKLPRYPQVGALYLSVVGVHGDYQSKGMGEFLLADAFKTAVDVADKVGAYFIVLDALNERAAKLYRRLGFQNLPSHENRMIIGMKAVRKAITQ